MPLDQSDNISAASLRILLIQNVQLPRTAATTQSSYETVTTTRNNVPRHLDNYNQHEVTITVRATLTNRTTMRREAAPFSNGKVCGEATPQLRSHTQVIPLGADIFRMYKTNAIPNKCMIVPRYGIKYAFWLLYFGLYFSAIVRQFKSSSYVIYAMAHCTVF